MYFYSDFRNKDDAPSKFEIFKNTARKTEKRLFCSVFRTVLPDNYAKTAKNRVCLFTILLYLLIKTSGNAG